ncbi:MAG: hypothetical protein P4M11_02045 [Candidatus Pacebacteria bacterium]|nr:hypothetical protein [Candidatus Paceibacterota bacterium]
MQIARASFGEGVPICEINRPDLRPRLNTVVAQLKGIAERVSGLESFSGETVTPAAAPEAGTKSGLRRTRMSTEYTTASGIKSEPDASTLIENDFQTFDLMKLQVQSPHGTFYRELATPAGTAKSSVVSPARTFLSPRASAPLEALGVRRVRKIATSPSYQKYLQHKRETSNVI